MRKTVLIVDDEVTNIRLIAEYLAKQKDTYELLTSLDPEQAFKVAAEHIPDLIILDWEMPKMTGIELLKVLKEDNRTHSIPVIIATGKMTSSENLATALEAGAEDYIRKPLDTIELEARIRTVLRLSEQYKQMEQMLKEEVELKNRKLATATMYTSERNQLLSGVVNRLSNMLEKPDESHQNLLKDLKALKKEVTGVLDMDENWNTYKIHFEEVHPQFFEKLKEEQPTLTNNDLKLCAYLCIGLENKEIAHMCNISYDGVKKSLYRLKKKFQLSEEYSLRTYISNSFA
ncbi:response regulator [Limibacter armeniacum]|uniref:response regulator n=1 Tax=Limibacter armeniacum TaxID=466084 RepID=UPI002FE5883F